MNSAINGCNCRRNWRSYNFSQGRPRSQAVRDHRVQQSVLVKQAELIPAPRILSSDLPSQISRPHGIPTARPRSCSAVGHGREAYAFRPTAASCRLLYEKHAIYYPTRLPARKSAAVDVNNHLHPRPSSSSFRSARPAADCLDRRPSRGCRLRCGGGDLRRATVVARR